MSHRKNPFVPVKDCHLLNNKPNHKNKLQQAFIWPKPLEGHEFTCVNSDLIITISKFLSAFDAVLHSNVPFQVKWGVYGLKRDYFTRYKDLNANTICEKHYFDVCQFLIKLNQHDRKMIFHEIQGKFQHYDVIRGLNYVDFCRGFGFLTYMIVFFEQWKNNLQEAFSVEFKFIENTKMINVLFSNKEYDDINKICKWYYPIYFRFATMMPSALKKFVDIYNLYKNNPASCILKSYDLEELPTVGDEISENIGEESAAMTQSDIVKNYKEVVNKFYDRGDDFDPNFDSCIYLNDINDINNQNNLKNDSKNDSKNNLKNNSADNSKNNIPNCSKPPKMRFKKTKSKGNEISEVVKKSKLEILEEKTPEFFEKQIETAVALAELSGC